MGKNSNILNQLGQTATDILTGGPELANDSRELFTLRGSFEDLQETQNYFNTNAQVLRNLSSDKPEEAKRKVDEANQYLLKAIDAITIIQASTLRFSDDFLGKTIEELSSALKSLKENKIYQKYHEEGLEGTLRRTAAKVFTPNKAALAESLGIAEGNMTSLNTGLNNLIIIPPQIKTGEPSNNQALNMILPVIEAKNKKDKFTQIAIAISKLPGTEKTINTGKEIPIVKDVLDIFGF